MKHTPGPWEIRTIQTNDGWITEIIANRMGPFGDTLATLPIILSELHDKPSAEFRQQMVDGHLMTAAPKLLKLVDDLSAALQNAIGHDKSMPKADRVQRRKLVDEARAIVREFYPESC